MKTRICNFSNECSLYEFCKHFQSANFPTNQKGFLIVISISPVKTFTFKQLLKVKQVDDDNARLTLKKPKRLKRFSFPYFIRMRFHKIYLVLFLWLLVCVFIEGPLGEIKMSMGPVTRFWCRKSRYKSHYFYIWKCVTKEGAHTKAMKGLNSYSIVSGANVFFVCFFFVTVGARMWRERFLSSV